MRTQIEADIRRLQAQCKKADDEMERFNDPLWQRAGCAYYLALGVVAKKLGAKVLLKLLCSSFFDIEDNSPDGVEVVLLADTEKDYRDFQKYTNVLSDAFAEIMGDGSKVSFYEMKMDEDDNADSDSDSNSDKTAKLKHAPKKSLRFRPRLSKS